MSCHANPVRIMNKVNRRSHYYPTFCLELPSHVKPANPPLKKSKPTGSLASSATPFKCAAVSPKLLAHDPLRWSSRWPSPVQRVQSATPASSPRPRPHPGCPRTSRQQAPFATHPPQQRLSCNEHGKKEPHTFKFDQRYSKPRPKSTQENQPSKIETQRINHPKQKVVQAQWQPRHLYFRQRFFNWAVETLKESVNSCNLDSTSARNFPYFSNPSGLSSFIKSRFIEETWV